VNELDFIDSEKPTHSTNVENALESVLKS